MLNQSDYIDSYYSASIKRPFISKPLDKEISCDVCIIGGGYTGLSSAIQLSKAGFDVSVLESNRVAWGASGRNGGQVCTGFNKAQETLEKSYGKEKASQLWQITENAKRQVHQYIDDYQIDCDYAPGILHTAFKKNVLAEYQHEIKVLNQNYNYKQIRYIDKAELSDMLGSDIYHGASLDIGAGHLQPLNYAIGLAHAAQKEGASIYEQTAAIDYTIERSNEHYPVLISTNHGFKVKSKKIIMACNGYLEKLEPSIAAYIMPLNNFLLASEPLGDTLAKSLIRDNVAVSDSKFVINYFRLSKDKRLIFGGGENYSATFPKDMKSFVRKYMLRVFPQLENIHIDYAWGGTLAITLNRLPDFGQLNQHVYYMQGYSGQGVALASYAGNLITEKMMHPNKQTEFDLLSTLTTKKFPGGTLLRRPGHILGMFYYSLKDRTLDLF